MNPRITALISIVFIDNQSCSEFEDAIFITVCTSLQNNCEKNLRIRVVLENYIFLVILNYEVGFFLTLY